MARDYARGKKAKTKKKSGVSAMRLFFTLIIIGGFAVGLLFLSQQPKDEQAPVPAAQQSQVEPSNPVTPTQPAKATKEPAETGKNTDKNNFDFYQLLPESEVEPPKVEAYKSTPKDPNKKTNTLLQAGSFRNKKDADSMRAKLILLNLPNVVVEKTTNSSGSTWYRVRVGPFANRSMLNKAEDILAQNHIAPLRINRK